MTELVTTAVGVIAKVAGPAVIERLGRQEAVLRALKQLGLSPSRMPRDFAGIYVYALVEYGVGKPEAMLEFLRDSVLQEGFRKTFESNERSHLQRAADATYEAYVERPDVQSMDYDLRRELPAFQATFFQCVTKSRTASETQQSLKIDELSKTLQSNIQQLTDKVGGLASLDDVQQVVSQTTTVALQKLARQPDHLSLLTILQVDSPGDFAAILEENLLRAGIAAVAVDARQLNPDDTAAASIKYDLCLVVAREGDPSATNIPVIESNDIPTLTFNIVDGLEVESMPPAASFTKEPLVHCSNDRVHDVIVEKIHLWLTRTYRRLTARLAEGGLPTAEIMRLQTRASHIRNVITTPLDEGSPLDALTSTVHAWLGVLRYEFEAWEREGESFVDRIVQVPARRNRYDRVLVRTVAGELSAAQVFSAITTTKEFACDEIWLIAHNRVSPSARIAADKEAEVYCYSLDELLEENADFSSYLDWLDSEVTTRGVKNQYVDLYCRKEESAGDARVASVYDDTNGGIDGYIDRWLEDPSKEHISVLGEFGTGKSWFSLHYASLLAERYRQARRDGRVRPRLPLVIPLRDYAKSVSLESLFSEFFFRKHQIALPSYAVFDFLNRNGKLVLIFDGFDEMASRVDRQAMINNFWELARVVVPGAKAILTCRSEHFPTQSEERALLGAELRASTATLTGQSPQFEQIHILPLRPQQIRAMLAQKTDERTIDRIVGHPALFDLLTRPVMSEVILDALPEVDAGLPISLTHVYMYAIRRKMDRDIRQERTFTSLSDKVLFLSELFWQMFTTDELAVNYRTFPATLQMCFGAKVEALKDLDHWHYDMLGQTILIRNADGDYAPAHRSFLEFFIAFKIAAELGILSDEYIELTRETGHILDEVSTTWSDYFNIGSTNKDLARRRLVKFEPSSPERIRALLATPLHQAIFEMIAEMVQAEKGSALSTIIPMVVDATRNGEDVDPTAVSSLIELLIHLDEGVFRDRDLSGINWSHTTLDFYQHERGLDLSGANLTGAVFRGADLENVTLREANLTGANLTDVKFFPKERAWIERLEMSAPDRVTAIVGQHSMASIQVGSDELTEISREKVGGRYHLAQGPHETTVLSASNRNQLDGHILKVTDSTGRSLPRAYEMPASTNDFIAIPSADLLVGLGVAGQLIGLSLQTGETMWVEAAAHEGAFGCSISNSEELVFVTFGAEVVHESPYGFRADLKQWRVTGSASPPELLMHKTSELPHPDAFPSTEPGVMSWTMRDNGASAIAWSPESESEESGTSRAVYFAYYDEFGVMLDHFSTHDCLDFSFLSISEQGDKLVLGGPGQILFYDRGESGLNNQLWADYARGATRDSSFNAYTTAGFSLDGTMLLVGRRDGTIESLNPADGTTVASLSLSVAYRGANFTGVVGLRDEQREVLARGGAIVD